MRKQSLGFLVVAAVTVLTATSSEGRAAADCIRVVGATWETQSMNPDPSYQVTMPMFN